MTLAVRKKTIEEDNAGYLRALIDQTFVARGMSKDFCQDQGFVRRVGLDALPPKQRVMQLHPRVGFVLSFYGSAQACFKAYPQLSTDEKLFFVMERRFHGLPQVSDPKGHAEACMAELQSASGWNSMATQKKFNAKMPVPSGRSNSGHAGGVIPDTRFAATPWTRIDETAPLRVTAPPNGHGGRRSEKEGNDVQNGKCNPAGSCPHSFGSPCTRSPSQMP